MGKPLKVAAVVVDTDGTIPIMQLAGVVVLAVDLVRTDRPLLPSLRVELLRKRFKTHQQVGRHTETKVEIQETYQDNRLVQVVEVQVVLEEVFQAVLHQAIASLEVVAQE
jgi:hypothetical protein